MSDPNSLLSTLSQSSAAMVAIIGGFLVSKLVAMSSEKEALKRQLKSAKHKLKHIKPAYESAHAYRLENSKNIFFEWVVDDLVKAGMNAVDYEALSSDNIPRGSSLDEMVPYAITIHERVKKAYRVVAPMLTGIYSDSDIELDDLKKRGLKIQEPDESIYEDVFDQLKSRLPEEPQISVMGALVPKMSNYAAGVSLGSVRPAWSREVDARRLDESIREEQNLKEKLATVEAEINRLTYDLDKQSKPVGILPAVWILSLLSLLGIVLPVVVMAFSPTKITVVVAVILIGAFILGLGAVLGYIVWYLKKISS